MSDITITFNTRAEKMNIYVDERPVYMINGKYQVQCGIGLHTLRVEQFKIFKSKWYFAKVLKEVFSGLHTAQKDIDGASPFYAMYEAEVFVDRDIEISLYQLGSAGGSKIQADIPQDLNYRSIRSAYTATKKERMKWFAVHALLYSFIFCIGLFVGIEAGFGSLSAFTGIAGAIFSWLVSAFIMTGWVFIICKIYRHAVTDRSFLYR